jgi:hypothetical protein
VLKWDSLVVGGAEAYYSSDVIGVEEENGEGSTVVPDVIASRLLDLSPRYQYSSEKKYSFIPGTAGWFMGARDHGVNREREVQREKQYEKEVVNLQ